MSINTLPSNSITTPRRTLPQPYVPQGNSAPPSAYVRPADWPALSSLTSTLIFSGLYAVNNTSMEYVAINVTGTGTLTVDWGDGTSETLTSGTLKQHQYNYSTLSTSVTTRGYKTALINVSTTATITIINLQVRPTPVTPNNALNANWGAKWLDIQVGGSNLAQISFGGTSPYLPLLEQASITSVDNTNWGSNNSQFQNCYSLQSCPTLNFGSLVTAKPASSMFQNCYNLRIAPTFDTSKFSSMSTMFLNCVKLQTVPVYDLSSCTTTTSMFSGCYTLRTIPSMNYSNVTSFSSMFINCYSLENVPDMRISSSATTLASMFGNCSSLRIAPMIYNTGNVNDFSSMFSGCIALTTVPLYNTISNTSCALMFQTCQALVSLPGPWNLPVCTSFQGMFSACASLIACPQFLTSTTLLTTTIQMFQNCFSLKTVPLFNTNAVTTMANMFINCYSLVTIPTFNTANVTTMNSMFQACYSLKTIPALNLSNVTNTFSMFNSARSLQSTPAFNTSNVLNVNGMFTSANALVTVGSMDWTKCTNAGATFSGCVSLTDVSNIANTGNIANLNSTFLTCTSLTSLPTSWDTSKVTDFVSFVSGATSLISIPTYNTINVTLNTNFAASTNSLVTIPALNFSNVTTSGVIASGGSTTTINSTGQKVTHSIVGTGIGATELQNYFANLGSNATSQTITITGVPGATTALSKTSGITAGSNVVTMANTVGVIANTYLYGTGMNTGIPITFVPASFTINYTSGGVNPLLNGDSIMFTNVGITTVVVINTQYFVINRTGTNFQISTTLGGSAVSFSGAGSGVMSIGGATISNQIVTVNANANVIIRGVAGVTNASLTLTNRALNQNYATTKNWTISG